MKIYVSNHGTFGAGRTNIPSITVYPALASGNATPIATLIGPNTGLTQTQFVAVDSTGRTYVSNQGTAGNSDITFSTITEYDNLQGNVAPVVTISNLRRPEGLAIDKNDNLLILTGNTIYGLPRGATSISQATTVIVGSNTQLFNDYGMFIESSGKLDLAGSNQVLTFAPGSNGNAMPQQNIAGPATQLYSDLGIAADAAGTLYVTNFDFNTINSYNSTDTTQPPANPMAPATGPAPRQVFASPLLNKPYGLFVDSGGAFYVANFGNNTILVFPSALQLASGATLQSISGSNTGLNNPIGVYVR